MAINITGYPTGTTVGTQTSGMSPQMEAKFLWLMDQAANFAAQPHGGLGAVKPQEVAGFTDMQSQAFDQIKGGFDPQSYKDYLNPYQDYVTQGISDDYAKAINKANLGAAGAGAFGGARQGIMHSELLGGRAQAIGQSLAGGYGAAMGMAREGYDKGIASLMGAGSVQQQNKQQQMDADYQAYLQNRQDPYQRFGFLSDIFGGTPSGQMAMTMGTSPQTNPLSQALGAGIFGAGIASGFGNV